MDGGAGGHGPDHAVCHHRRVRGTRMVTALLAPAAFVLVACGGASGERTARTQTTTPAREPAGSATAAAAAAVGPSWPTYGGSPSRSGVAPNAPARPQPRRRFERSLDGEV